MKKALLALFVLLLFAVTLWAVPTALSVVVSFDPLTDLVCNGDGTGGTATIHYSVTSQDAAGATLYYNVTGDATIGPVSLPSISAGLTTDTPAGDWTQVGSDKTYSSSFQLALANGTYTIEVCADQPGRTNTHHACSQTTIVIACSVTNGDTCDRSGVFGEVVGNTNLCKSGGTINFQFAGLFGPSTTVTVTGPNNFNKTYNVAREGDSCNYHLQLKPLDEGMTTAGSYTFKVLDGSIINDTESLSCSKK